MRLDIVSGEEYFRIFPKPSNLFVSEKFTRLNEHKTCSLIGLVLRNGKDTPRLGLIGGMDSEGGFKAPFSAPFAMIESPRSSLRLETVKEFADLLSRKFSRIYIALAPWIYYANPLRMTVEKGGFRASGATILKEDFNYHFDTSRDFRANLDPAAKNRLNKSIASNLTVRQSLLTANPSLFDVAYSVIARNRSEKGYPLAMKKEEMIATGNLIPIDVFVAYHGEVPVAASINYLHSCGVAEVIYWGNIRESNRYCPMYRLASEVFDHYRQEGVRYIDLGPASVGGEADMGLCDFKESVGGLLSFKSVFRTC